MAGQDGGGMDALSHMRRLSVSCIFMKEAGLGGAEIAILYPLAADDEKKRDFQYPFLLSGVF